jgi:hypothetical protein
MMPASARLPELRPLIDKQACFVIHAPRQTDKTTTVFQLARELVAEGRYNVVVVTTEPGQAFSEDTGAAELAMLDGWRADAVLLPAELQPPPNKKRSPLGTGDMARRRSLEDNSAAPRNLGRFNSSFGIAIGARGEDYRKGCSFSVPSGRRRIVGNRRLPGACSFLYARDC